MKFSPIHLVRSYIGKVTDRHVISGPFSGILYVKESLGSEYFPKLLGTYELELHEIISTLNPRNFRKIVVIGAGEGYYAVGFAKKWKLPVIAYEKDPKGRELLTRLSLINRCNNVLVRGEFLRGEPLKLENEFLVMDVEGNEMNIMDQNQFQTWRNSTMIIEVHSDEIREALIERSMDSHRHLFIPVAKRKLEDYPFHPPLSFIFKRWWISCLQEWREDSIGWLVFTPV